MGCLAHTGLGVLQCSDLRYAESTGTVPGECHGHKPRESPLRDSSGCRNTLISMLNPSCRCLHLQSWFLALTCRAASSSPSQPSHDPKGCRTGWGEGTSAWPCTTHSCFKCTKTGSSFKSRSNFILFSAKHFFPPVLALLLSKHDL